MITSDDVLTVLKEEAEEDALRLAGVGDEEITDGVLTKTKRRFNWLLLNLFTAFLATYCISLFGATIEQMVVLAFLMPIVASMGGNAGMQTLAVTVRTLATNDLTKNNFNQNILKEFNIGILNGVIFAIISSFIVQLWFQDIQLSLIISIGVLVKEISILLYFPFLYLFIYEKFYFKLDKILIFFLPLIVFICIRKFISGSVTDMGQIRYDILRDPFDFYYFNRNFYEVGLQNFFARVANSLIFIIIISFYLRIKFKLEKQIFLMCILFTFLIVLANFCLASGVMRVSQIALPFLLFYSLESIFQKYRN